MGPQKTVPVTFTPEGHTLALILDPATAAALGIEEGKTYGVVAMPGEIHLRDQERESGTVSE